jgi:MFS family permease
MLFVHNRNDHAVEAKPDRAVRRRALLDLVRRRDYLAVVVAGAVLGCFTVSDALIYLTFQRRTSMNLAFFPLLYVGTAVVYLIFAVPAGRFADRAGRSFVFLLGFGFLLAIYGILIVVADPGPFALIGMLAMLGIYYACTDGVLAAIATALLPEDLRTRGLAVLNGAVAAGRLVSSILFGLLWSRQGTHSAVQIFFAGLTIAMLAAGFQLFGRRNASGVHVVLTTQESRHIECP